MESKCPVCKAGTIEDWNRKVRQCDSCGFQCDTDDLPRIAAAMDAEQRLVELQEAVRWEMECYALSRLWKYEMCEEVFGSLEAARAAVDALVGEG